MNNLNKLRVEDNSAVDASEQGKTEMDENINMKTNTKRTGCRDAIYYATFISQWFPRFLVGRYVAFLAYALALISFYMGMSDWSSFLLLFLPAVSISGVIAVIEAIKLLKLTNCLKRAPLNAAQNQAKSSLSLAYRLTAGVELLIFITQCLIHPVILWLGGEAANITWVFLIFGPFASLNSVVLLSKIDAVYKFEDRFGLDECDKGKQVLLSKKRCF